MKEPLFSVIIPTRNRPGMLLEAVRSVLDQSVDDWQLVIIDDHSSRAVSSILPSQVVTDKRILLIRNKRQSGVAYSRNLGIEKATGRWLLFLDDDDVLEHGFLAAAQSDIANLPPDQIIAMPCKMHPQSNKQHWAYHTMKVQVASNRRRASRSISSFASIILSPPQITSMICRSELLNTLRFAEDLDYGEDLLLWAELLQSQISVKTIYDRGESCALIRYHGADQLSQRDAQGILTYFRKFQRRFGPLDDKTEQAINAKLLMRALWSRQWQEAVKRFALGMKKPRIFLGHGLSQVWLKSQILLSYLLYRLIRLNV